MTTTICKRKGGTRAPNNERHMADAGLPQTERLSPTAEKTVLVGFLCRTREFLLSGQQDGKRKSFLNRWLNFDFYFTLLQFCEEDDEKRQHSYSTCPPVPKIRNRVVNPSTHDFMPAPSKVDVSGTLAPASAERNPLNKRTQNNGSER
ncbi:hypothetical protein CEXT_207771 [Caerostris extrusa]|uniref:Uncharacterized protein n=1 Tax=Caerostris extrusa TaxID=172846 RepID=A0AAV4TK16_CAEEX|nr:hypothetical protein CEXT_207771 [Caerostris extrusa]